MLYELSIATKKTPSGLKSQNHSSVICSEYSKVYESPVLRRLFQCLSPPKKSWQLSELAFRELLQWLDEGKDSEGQSFLEMRDRLVAYFDRKGC